MRALILSFPILSKRNTTAGKNIIIARKEVDTPRAAARPKSENPLKSIMISEKKAATVVIAPEKIEGIVFGSESFRASSVSPVFSVCSLKRPRRCIEKSIPRPYRIVNEKAEMMLNPPTKNCIAEIALRTPEESGKKTINSALSDLK